MFRRIFFKQAFAIIFFMLLLLTTGCKTDDSDNGITETSDIAQASLCINEFMASNSSVLADLQGEYEDWIEIYNSGEESVSLNGMYLSDDSDDPDKWQFPDITINPGEFLIIWADEDTEDEGIHASFKLSSSGETLALFNADQTLLDTVTFDVQSEDISFGRYPEGSDKWGFLNPTPGSANTDIISESSQPADSERPDGWTKETHGDNAEPNYDIVFPEDEVGKIELVIDPEEWQAMMDDMTDIYGEFGAGENQSASENNPPDDGQMPFEMTEACIGKNEGDACEITMQEQLMSGACIVEGEGLICMPDNMGGRIPGSQMPDAGRPDGGMAGDGQMPDAGRPDGGMAGDGQMPDAGRPDGGMAGGGNLEFADRNPIWKPCTFRFENKVWNHVGVRFKGNSSLQSTWRSGIWKLPFRFDFDQFEDDYPEIDNQRFYGFKKLTLSSNYGDDSLLREKVAADIFRDAGVPAPKTAFHRVYIDHGEGFEYFGLYTMVEVPANPMLESYFGNCDGNLYKSEGPGATFATFDEDSFDKETNEDKADWSDVRTLFEVLHSSRDDAAAWRASLEKILNVDGFLRWLAVNTLIQNWDTYGCMSHNYYLYNNTENGLINWIPWDNNFALMSGMGGDREALSLSLTEVNDNWPLIRYLADDPAYWEKYVSFVGETTRGAFEPEKMKAIYQAASDLIRPYVVGDEGETEGYTFLNNAAEFDAAIEYLNTHVESRYDAASEFIEK
ncbi:CotH kinase family protein [Desulfonema magnum]|uniref:Lamin tail domain-containing protein n=1 Tax=Desulfonema magnum TaxID=45655 RepID=A0A975BI03_9BACT|nr:CotH kinase family protein [Desulfonema magnum]QTA85655.1 Lamin tail domain-containing protein [Desulfonema magnum]